MAVNTPAPSPVSLSHEHAPRWSKRDASVLASLRIYNKCKHQTKSHKSAATIDSIYFIGTDAIDLYDESNSASFFLLCWIVKAVDLCRWFPFTFSTFRISFHIFQRQQQSIKCGTVKNIENRCGPFFTTCHKTNCIPRLEKKHIYFFEKKKQKTT